MQSSQKTSFLEMPQRREEFRKIKGIRLLRIHAEKSRETAGALQCGYAAGCSALANSIGGSGRRRGGTGKDERGSQGAERLAEDLADSIRGPAAGIPAAGGPKRLGG